MAVRGTTYTVKIYFVDGSNVFLTTVLSKKYDSGRLVLEAVLGDKQATYEYQERQIKLVLTHDNPVN